VIMMVADGITEMVVQETFKDSSLTQEQKTKAQQVLLPGLLKHMKKLLTSGGFQKYTNAEDLLGDQEFITECCRHVTCDSL